MNEKTLERPTITYNDEINWRYLKQKRKNLQFRPKTRTIKKTNPTKSKTKLKNIKNQLKRVS